MQMRALAVAVTALAASSAHAQTNVQLFGLVDAFAGYFTTETPAGKGSAMKVDSGGMSTSHFGIRGTEDLGGGLKAVFAIEAFYRPDTGMQGRFNGDTFFARNAFVGLDGGFGRTTIGRNTTSYFLSTIIFNPYGDSFVFSPLVRHTFRGYLQNDSGWSNSLSYSTPSMGGLRLTGQYSFAANGGDSERFDNERNSERGKSWSGAANYFKGPLAATVTYQSTRFETGTAPATALNTQDALIVGGSYDFGMAKLFANYQFIEEDRRDANDRETNTYHLGASVKAGPGSVLGAYANSKTKQSGTADIKHDTWAIGYLYPMSKRTDIYLNYFYDERKGGAVSKDQVAGLGIRHRF